jgi:hypothetical protein
MSFGQGKKLGIWGEIFRAVIWCCALGMVYLELRTKNQNARNVIIKMVESVSRLIVRTLLVCLICSVSIGCSSIAYQVVQNPTFKFSLAFGEVGSYTVAKKWTREPDVLVTSEVSQEVIRVIESSLNRLGYLNLREPSAYQGFPDFTVSYQLESNSNSGNPRKLTFSIDMTSNIGMRTTKWIWRGTATGVECAPDGSCDGLAKAAEELLSQFPKL